MTDFLSRLKTEQMEIEQRRDKLYDFTKTENFSNLDFANQYLLTKQLKLMTEYNMVLCARLSILDKGE